LIKDSWFEYLKRGWRRQLPPDRIAASQGGYGDVWVNLKKHLLPFVKRHWRMGLVGALLILLNSALAFPGPLIGRFLIDQVILGKQANLLVIYVVLMGGVYLLGMLTSTVQGWYFTRFDQAVVLDLETDLLDHTLRLPKSFFDETEVGYMMSRLSDVTGLRWFFSSTMVNIFTNIIQMIGGVALLFYLEWHLAILALVVLPGLVWWARYFSHRMRALSHQSMELSANVSKRMQESLSSTSLIKAYAAEDRAVESVMSQVRANFQLALEQTAVGTVAGTSLSLLYKIFSAIIMVAGALLVIAGHWTLGSLTAFQAYVGYVYSPAQFLANINLQFQGARAALERVSAIYDTVPEETGVGIPTEHLTGNLEFRHVCFSYGDNEAVLQNISFCVRPKEHVAIVGPSGVGKTTLISLLLRFYKPTSGEVYFDNRPASEYELASLRQRIGYVSQSTLLLSGTILENLIYGNPGASQEQVERASHAAGIHDFIVSLPEGYATQVGEKGVRLSEGQKQRLAIARALIKEPDILILDEPTSALDSIVERSIFDALPALVQDKTLFIVAHRLSTIQNSDSILVLNESRLIAIGTHESLLEGCEFYRELVAKQQING
jgi:ABC-type bacteriocin/lantibiotic exporter with double-glycine peptidase domain